MFVQGFFNALTEERLHLSKLFNWFFHFIQLTSIQRTLFKTLTDYSSHVEAPLQPFVSLVEYFVEYTDLH